MPKMQVNDGGVIRTLKKVQANDGGVIRSFKKVQTNVSGVIRTVFQSEILEKDIVSFRVVYALAPNTTLSGSMAKNGTYGVVFQTSAVSSYPAGDSIARLYNGYVFAVTADGALFCASTQSTVDSVDYLGGILLTGSLYYWYTYRMRNRDIKIQGSHYSAYSTTNAKIWNYDWDNYVNSSNTIRTFTNSFPSSNNGYNYVGGYLTSSGNLNVYQTISGLTVDGVTKPYTVEILE